VFGFLGPNGAGKTTTVKILLGLVHATSGRAAIFGQPVDRAESRRAVGYLPENFRFHEWLTGRELLDFHGRLAGMGAEERGKRIPEVLARVGLAGRGDDRVGGYSKGMTQRIGLAQAILHRPRLVLLDEPTSALDPIGRREVRDFIRGLRAEGVAVFLNSHLLSEVEMVCDRVAIVDRGQVVAAGPLAELVGGTAELRLELDRVDDAVRALLGRFGRVFGVDGRQVRVVLADGRRPAEVVAALVAAGVGVDAAVPVQRTLEDVFVGLVEGRDG